MFTDYLVSLGNSGYWSYGIRYQFPVPFPQNTFIMQDVPQLLVQMLYIFSVHLHVNQASTIIVAHSNTRSSLIIKEQSGD